MKKSLCLVVIAGVTFLGVAAAAEEYSPEDYTTFHVMQRIANAHFSLVKHVNKQSCAEAKSGGRLLCPGAYWFSDQRNSEPDPTRTLSLSQGLLFNPKTRTLYSRLGAWCFSSEAMYKLAHSHCVPRASKENVWQSFQDSLVEIYHMQLSKREEPHEEYVVHTFNGTYLPTVIFEEPPFGLQQIEGSSVEDLGVLAENELPPESIAYPVTSRLPFHLILAFSLRWIGRWPTSQPVEEASELIGEMVPVLEIPHGRSVHDQPCKEHDVQYTHDQEHFLAVWREMKRKFEAAVEN